MGGLETLIGALGLSFVSGINLYAAVLVVGLGLRYGWFPFLPEQLQVLSDPWVIGIAGTFYLLEFFADKVPFVNTVWDGIHTFIRPVGAALMALGAAEELGPAAQVIAMLVGGSVALGTHSTKAGFRLLANTAPEPATHSVISVAEDVGVVGLLALVYTYPVPALVLLVVLLALMAYITPLIFRTLRFLVGSVGSAVFGWADSASDSPAERPGWVQAELEGGPTWRVYKGYARSVSGAPVLSIGYLAVSDLDSYFVRKGWLGVKSLRLGSPTRDVRAGVLCDIVEFDSDNRVCLTKKWARLYRERFGGPEPADSVAATAL